MKEKKDLVAGIDFKKVWKAPSNECHYRSQLLSYNHCLQNKEKGAGYHTRKEKKGSPERKERDKRDKRDKIIIQHSVPHQNISPSRSNLNGLCSSFGVLYSS